MTEDLWDGEREIYETNSVLILLYNFHQQPDVFSLSLTKYRLKKMLRIVALTYLT